MRVVAHRAVEEVDRTADARELLQQDHLLHIVPGQPVRGGDEEAIQLARAGRVAEAVEPRAGQALPL